MIKVILAPRKSGAALGRHPWVFSGAIVKVEGDVHDGEEVAVHGADDRRFIAYGLYNSKSDIRVRLYSWKEDERLSAEFFRKGIERAIGLRKELRLLSPVEACRLVFSESDGLSGLVVDRYGEYLVLQVTSLGIFQRLNPFVETLREFLSPKGIFIKAVGDKAKKEGFEIASSAILGEYPSHPVWISDGELEFEAELQTGQKTGFYLDQKENRKAAAKFADGRRVLDLYCNSGGFAIHCARGGAEDVWGVDSSEQAIAAARRNSEKNGISNIQWHESDVFEFMKANASQKFSMVIADPPRLVASQASKERGMKVYYRLNTEAMKLLRSGGILVTCSCSGRVLQDEWLSMLASVAARSKRSLQILEIRGASVDHPINAHCPETQYLKCVIARVA